MQACGVEMCWHCWLATRETCGTSGNTDDITCLSGGIVVLEELGKARIRRCSGSQSNRLIRNGETFERDCSLFLLLMEVCSQTVNLCNYVPGP